MNPKNGRLVHRVLGVLGGLGEISKRSPAYPQIFRKTPNFLFDNDSHLA
jgi:hypothetical protein